MRYRRWSFGFSVTLDPDWCSRCGQDADAGRHTTVPECPSGDCKKPREHHTFRRRRLPLAIKREDVW